MISIHPQYLPLASLLNNRLFKIPEFQRAYSWTSKERCDLFSDIEKTHLKGVDAGHFMAAVVCLRRNRQVLGTDEFQVVEVVDGQQRLTTLIILLKTIALSLDPNNKLAIELQELLVKPETDALLLLQTNHDSSHYFVNFLRDGISSPIVDAKNLADRELLSAIEDCKKFVDNWLKQHKTISPLVALLKNRLFFLFHEIEDEQSVYTVFEVLNSRGLDVSWLDRLKSILMGAAFELKAADNSDVVAELHHIWRDIYSTIGLRQLMSKEVLRFAATLYSRDFPARTLGEEDSVDVLRGASSTNAGEVRKVAQWMLKVANAYNIVMSNPRLNAVTRISHARLLAVAIYLRDDFNPQQRDALLSRWEKVTFRVFGMLGNDARKRVGDYVRLAWKTIREKLSFEDVDNALEEIGKSFTIDQSVEAMRNSNCYDRWESELRYLMFRYEEHLAKTNPRQFNCEQWEKIWMVSPSESIEHILPQSKAPEDVVHNLGNLLLLPPRVNSSLKARDPKDKADDYRRTGLLIANEVADLLKNGKEWDSKAIKNREEALLAWATKEWAD